MSKQKILLAIMAFILVMELSIITPSLHAQITPQNSPNAYPSAGVSGASEHCWKSVDEMLDTPANMGNFTWPMCSELEAFDKGLPKDKDPMDEFDNPSSKVPLRNQNDSANGALASVDCGPTSMGMIADYYKNVLKNNNILNLSTAELAKIAGTNSNGTTINQLIALAKVIGFNNTEYSSSVAVGIIDVFSGGALSYNKLSESVSSGYPTIVSVDLSPYSDGHALVVTGISNGKVTVNNPFDGITQTISQAEFNAMWKSKGYGYVIPKP